MKDLMNDWMIVSNKGMNETNIEQNLNTRSGAVIDFRSVCMKSC